MINSTNNETQHRDRQMNKYEIAKLIDHTIEEIESGIPFDKALKSAEFIIGESVDGDDEYFKLVDEFMIEYMIECMMRVGKKTKVEAV